LTVLNGHVHKDYDTRQLMSAVLNVFPADYDSPSPSGGFKNDCFKLSSFRASRDYPPAEPVDFNITVLSGHLLDICRDDPSQHRGALVGIHARTPDSCPTVMNDIILVLKRQI
jgi:hypothetical protein